MIYREGWKKLERNDGGLLVVVGVKKYMVW